MDEEVRDLLELTAFGNVENVVAAVMEIIAGSANGRKCRVAGNNTGQRNGFFWFEAGLCLAHLVSHGVRLE